MLLRCLLLTALVCAAQTAPLATEAAANLLASLAPEQRAKLQLPFTSENRFDWHFIPRDRQGLLLKDMTPGQKQLGGALLAAGLSQRGYLKAVTIMSLDEILREMEQPPRPGLIRDPERYAFTIFGEPAERGVWGYRIEGHHLSLNFTLVDGRVAGSPSFLGANPAEVRQGPRKGLRVLSREEDLARSLASTLTQAQRKVAILSDKAPGDILTMNSRKAALEGKPGGITLGQLDANQKKLLRALVEEFAQNLAPPLARDRMAKLDAAGANLHFAWLGVLERGGPHYYRVQAPAFLIEYDNTQNDANHIHTVWRDFDGDFGLDLLDQHYRKAQHHDRDHKK